MTGDDHEDLLAREKPSYDGAEPSGNSVQVLNLLRLGEFTSDKKYWTRASRALSSFHPILTQSPVSLSEMLLAVDFYLDAPREIVIITPKSREQAEPFLSQLNKSFVPNRILTVLTPGDLQDSHAKLIPFVKHKVPIKGESAAYVCSKGVCKFPTADPEVFLKQIGEVKAL